MLSHSTDQFSRIETTCGLLLCELQEIWNEMGEPDAERDSMLLEIEQECLAVYRSKVDEAKRCKADLLKAIAIGRTEIADISSSMGGLEIHASSNNRIGENLKEELDNVNSQLEEMRKKKMGRKNQFVEVLDRLQNISFQLGRTTDDYLNELGADETDLSMKKLEELRQQLVELQNEKSNRLKKIESNLDTLNSLCLVLGKDFNGVIREIHPSLVDSKTKDVSRNTLDKLAMMVQRLHELKSQRMQKLQDLAISLLELWNLLNTPMEEQKIFQNVTSKIAASESEIIETNILSTTSIKCVEDEVMRLSKLKSTKIKELILRKRLELEEICRQMHMATEVLKSTEYSTESIEAGVKDPEYLLEQIDCQIATVKEEACSRKEILDKVEKWMAACEEESWLEEYNRDDNRYNAGRGAHLTLKRAEKARVLVNKIPGMVEALTVKVSAWEKEKGIEFFYDGVRLLFMLGQYNTLRKERELEKQRQRDQKKLQGQLLAEQEALYGSKRSPTKSGKKTSRTSAGVLNNRKLSLGGAMLQNLKPEKATPHALPNRKNNYWDQNSTLRHQFSSGLPTPSSARRNSEIHSRLGKKQLSGKVPETKTPLVRKPLSPIPSNILNSPEDLKETDNGCLKRLITPTKLVPAGDEEKTETASNKTASVSVPATPAVSVAMQMATTPATPFVASGSRTVEKRIEHVEYSFEEVRAGFASRHKTLVKPVLQA